MSDDTSGQDGAAGFLVTVPSSAASSHVVAHGYGARRRYFVVTSDHGRATMKVPRNATESDLMGLAAQFGIGLRRVTSYRYTIDADTIDATRSDGPPTDWDLIVEGPAGLEGSEGATANELFAYFYQHAESCD